jgi:hypothetical protein
MPGSYEEENTAIQDDDKGKEPARGRKKLGSLEFDLGDVEDIQHLFEVAAGYREHYKQVKNQAGQYAHKLLQAQEENAGLQQQLEAHPPYPDLPNTRSEDTTTLQADNERLRVENEQLRASLNRTQQHPPRDATRTQLSQLQEQLDLLQRGYREGTGGSLNTQTSVNPLNYRPRAEGPSEALDGSSVEKYHGWRFAIDQKFEEDRTYYGDDHRCKVAYALKKMVSPIFNTMQRFINSKPESTYLQFMAELENMMGVHMEARNAKKELRHITMKSSEKVSEFFHRIHPLWCVAKVPEDEQIEQFLATLLPHLTNGLLAEEFTSVTALFDKVRKIESRKIDQLDKHPRNTFNKGNNSTPNNRTSVPNQGTPQAPSRPAGSPATATPKARAPAITYPNEKFGAVAKKPDGWIGAWHDPETNPKKLSFEERAALQKQGRCWSCRGSGHRSSDTCCPFHQDKKLLSNLAVAVDSDDDSLSEN